MSEWSCSVVSDPLRPQGMVAPQAPPSMGFSRQEYWSGLLFPSPGNIPDPGIGPRSPALQADALPYELKGLEAVKLQSYINSCLREPWSFPRGASHKETACQFRRHKRHRLDPWVGKIPWRRAWQPIPVFLPGKSHGQRGLADYRPQGHKESDMTEATFI